MTQKQLRQMLQKYLMASYCYYLRYQSVMPDSEYDAMAKTLLKHWDEFQHQHKHLVDKEDLAAGTLFKMKFEDYPLMVIAAAEMWLEQSHSMDN